MFHVELRQFPHVARAFNLSREELDAGILIPWARGTTIELQERSWEPRRARLSIYEGRALETDEIGLGRGWANAGRTGQDVTERLLAEASQKLRPPSAPADLARALFDRCATGALTLHGVVELVGEREPGMLASERLGVAERLVWEGLHAGRLALMRDDRPVEREQWRPVLLSWIAWTEAGPGGVLVVPAQS